MTTEREWMENEGEPEAQLEAESKERPTDYTHAEVLANVARLASMDLHGEGL